MQNTSKRFSHPESSADVEKNVAHAWRGLKYPDSDLVALIARTVPNRSGLAIDIGCGSGRHTRMLSDFGFDALGIESDPISHEIALGNGVNAVCCGLEDFRPSARPTLVVAWGLAPLGNVEAFGQSVARLQADFIVCDWRTPDNSFIRFPETERHTVNTVTVRRKGHVLDGLHYRYHTAEACRIPGYERLLMRTVTKREGEEINEWFQTSFRRIAT